MMRMLGIAWLVLMASACSGADPAPAPVPVVDHAPEGVVLDSCARTTGNIKPACPPPTGTGNN